MSLMQQKCKSLVVILYKVLKKKKEKKRSIVNNREDGGKSQNMKADKSELLIDDATERKLELVEKLDVAPSTSLLIY